jgi:hypothetical protein
LELDERLGLNSSLRWELGERSKLSQMERTLWEGVDVILPDWYVQECLQKGLVDFKVSPPWEVGWKESISLPLILSQSSEQGAVCPHSGSAVGLQEPLCGLLPSRPHGWRGPRYVLFSNVEPPCRQVGENGGGTEGLHQFELVGS